MTHIHAFTANKRLISLANGPQCLSPLYSLVLIRRSDKCNAAAALQIPHRSLASQKRVIVSAFISQRWNIRAESTS